jgi:hypothetical protein
MDRRRGLSKDYFWIPDTFSSKMTHRGKRNREVAVEKNGRLVGRRTVE